MLGEMPAYCIKITVTQHAQWDLNKIEITLNGTFAD